MAGETKLGYFREKARIALSRLCPAALLIWILVPVLALPAFVSLFGIPVGFTLLFVVLPMLALLGSILIGTRIGLAILRRDETIGTHPHPYLAAILGVAILQVIGLVPFIGGVIGFVAAVLGTGALALVAWDAWTRDGAVARETVPAGERVPAGD